MTTTCKGCQKEFTFAPDTIQRRGMKPSFCESCKVAKRKAVALANVKRRQLAAEELGIDSKRRGLRLQPLTIRTYTEVAEIMGISAESARQLERRALMKIRKYFKFDLLSKQIDNSLRSHNEHKY